MGFKPPRSPIIRVDLMVVGGSTARNSGSNLIHLPHLWNMWLRCRSLFIDNEKCKTSWRTEYFPHWICYMRDENLIISAAVQCQAVNAADWQRCRRICSSPQKPRHISSTCGVIVKSMAIPDLWLELIEIRVPIRPGLSSTGVWRLYVERREPRAPVVVILFETFILRTRDQPEPGEPCV